MDCGEFLSNQLLFEASGGLISCIYYISITCESLIAKLKIILDTGLYQRAHADNMMPRSAMGKAAMRRQHLASKP